MASTTLDAPSALAVQAGAIRFHLSLNVNDLDKSVAFYRTLFDIEPAKRYDDYAKFELADPPLVLALEPQAHAKAGALNHLGFRLADSAALVAIQHRLEAAGIPATREEGVECCYAKQTKFWVNDPDGNNWEMYVVEHEVGHRGAALPPRAGESKVKPAQGLAKEFERPEQVWEHQLGSPFPESIPMDDGRCDRVLLKGTFNEPRPGEEVRRILLAAHRALRPGGKLLVHGLVADRPLNGAAPKLPGPAAAVRYVPTRAEVLAAVQSAGFAGLTLAKLSPIAVFEHDRIALRELMLEAVKRDASPFDLKQCVAYCGPLREVSDDAGNVYPRGKRVLVGGAAVETLRDGPAAASFIFFPPGEFSDE